MIKQDLCPCGSGKLYSECCEKYHKGEFPENALALMRSRYSGYAKGLIEYIIETTHPHNPNFTKEVVQWRLKIQEFCKNTNFEGLDIIEFIDGEKVAYVTFRAHLSRGKEDVSFTERSRFFKIADRWLYVDGALKLLKN